LEPAACHGALKCKNNVQDPQREKNFYLPSSSDNFFVEEIVFFFTWRANAPDGASDEHGYSDRNQNSGKKIA
jgi:hypothetical protein